MVRFWIGGNSRVGFRRLEKGSRFGKGQFTRSGYGIVKGYRVDLWDYMGFGGFWVTERLLSLWMSLVRYYA